MQEGSQRHIPENRNPKLVMFYEYHTSDLELKRTVLSSVYYPLINKDDAD
jgi:hypothetical protein